MDMDTEVNDKLFRQIRGIKQDIAAMDKDCRDRQRLERHLKIIYRLDAMERLLGRDITDPDPKE